ncbi:MAG: VWA domain-containing protein [Melioribacteraceae bacterium]|nr:VWA domain-containing protein [Melioribacteraceae bacterium]
MKTTKSYLILFLIGILAISCSVNSPDDDGIPDDLSYPHKPVPENNSANQALAVEISWSAEGIEEFDVYFGRDSRAKLFYRTVTNNKVVVSGLVKNTQYFWKIISKSSDGDKEGAIWSFVTSNTADNSGFVMIEHKIFTGLPNKVNIMFQVLDFQSRGIADLTIDNFEVLEDDQPISPTESKLTIKKRDELDYKLRTVLLLDNSTSISTEDLTAIKQAASSFVDQLHPNDEVALYEFSDEAVLLQNFTNDKGLLKSKIDQMASGFATTNLYGAIIEASGMLEEEFNDNQIIQSALLVFTDGSDTQGSSTFPEARNAISLKRCYTIGLGNEIDPDVLESLGTAGFYSINNVSELQLQFEEIQKELYDFANSFYWVNYNSPKRGDKEHTLRLSILANPNMGSNSYVLGSFSSSGFFSVIPGIYINSSIINPAGIDTLKLLPNESREIFATSYLLENISKYEWTTFDANIAKAIVKREPADFSNAVIQANAGAVSGNQTKVKVRDVNNSDYEKELVVIIK